MNNNNPKRIFWLLDEVIAESDPANWEEIRRISREIIGRVGNPDIDHHIIDPIESFNRLAKQLEGNQFSCVLDLTGWLTPSLKALFPRAEVLDTFSLSRVRVVSSPTLETTGHIMSMSRDKIDERKRNLDMSRPLIIDDTSFSGWTSRKTMELWGIDPKAATHGFLMANVGTVGRDKGAVDALRDLGGNVVYDLEIKSPEDDSWHVKDLYQSNNLPAAIDLSLEFYKILKESGLESQAAKDFLNNEKVVATLFPQKLTVEEIRRLASEKRFIFNNNVKMKENEVHSRNPFLWASPYFQPQVDMDSLAANKFEILGELQRLHGFVNNSEGKREASKALRQEMNTGMGGFGMKEHMNRRRERL